LRGYYSVKRTKLRRCHNGKPAEVRRQNKYQNPFPLFLLNSGLILMLLIGCNASAVRAVAVEVNPLNKAGELESFASKGGFPA
jgi:hypothetical protein